MSGTVGAQHFYSFKAWPVQEPTVAGAINPDPLDLLGLQPLAEDVVDNGAKIVHVDVPAKAWAVGGSDLH